jgi:thiamine-monophosphate kinase
MQLATSSDMLVEGRHFLSTVAPQRLGHKALAVNLSDLAACGAKPLAFTLALALPRADEAFLEGFSRGLLALADAHDCELVGGDTTQGPLHDLHQRVRRSAGGCRAAALGCACRRRSLRQRPLGDARLALEVFRGALVLEGAAFEQCAWRWKSRSRGLRWAWRCAASRRAAIDVSDGLLGDLAPCAAPLMCRRDGRG